MTEVPSVQGVANELQTVLSEISPTALDAAAINLRTAEAGLQAATEDSGSSLVADMLSGIALAKEALDNARDYLALGAMSFTSYLAEIGAEGVSAGGESGERVATTAMVDPGISGAAEINPLVAAATAEAQTARERMDGMHTKDRLEVLRGLSDAALCELLKTDHPDADHVLIERHRGLLYMFARTELLQAQRRGDVRGMDEDDLWVEGALKFLESSYRFDPAQGYELGTFAGGNARHQMQRALAKQGHNVRIPEDFRTDVLSKVRQLNAERLNTGRPVLSEAEIARLTGVTEEEGEGLRTVGDVYRAARLTTHLGSLDTGYSGREMGGAAGFIVDERQALRPTSGEIPPGPEETVVRGLLREAVGEMLKTIKPEEQRWIRIRFGLDGNDPLTMRDAALETGISMSIARMTEAKILNKLRHHTRSRHVRDWNEY